MREIKKEVVYDFIEEYINSQKLVLNKKLEELRQNAISDNIPIIKPDVINFLKVMLTLKKPLKILEIGTAYAFSTILMKIEVPDAKIVTIERDERMIEHANQNVKDFNFEDDIKILAGDGVEKLKSIDETKEKFDLVFIDASKAHYNEFMKESKRLLNNEGIIIADNVLYKGLVAKDRFEVIRRDRTIHKRMREFVKEAYDDEKYNTCLIPVGDGILMSIKK